MQGEIRVTVIATGFDRAVQPTGTVQQAEMPLHTKGAPVIPFPAQRNVRPSGGATTRPGGGDGPTRRPVVPPPQPLKNDADLSDMEIPTFIRRQMD